MHVRRRGARLDDLAAQPPGEADPLALDVRPGVTEQGEGRGVAAELEPDLLEDRVRVVLDEGQALLVQDLERLERPGQERQACDGGVGTGGLPSGAAPGATGDDLLGHRSSSWAATGMRRRRRSVRSSWPARPLSGRAGSSTTRARLG